MIVYLDNIIIDLVRRLNGTFCSEITQPLFSIQCWESFRDCANKIFRLVVKPNYQKCFNSPIMEFVASVLSSVI